MSYQTTKTAVRPSNAPSSTSTNSIPTPSITHHHQKHRSLLSRAAYHIHTVYLFTASDHKTFVLPETLFGILAALSGPVFTTTATTATATTVAARLPHVLLWTYLNTLVFTLSNQSSPAAIAEDALNKPWRPLPAQRLTLRAARRAQLLAIPLTLLVTHTWLGSAEETALLFTLTWMYNELGAADEAFHVRNGVIAAAYFAYGLGALRVAAGVSRVGFEQLTATAWAWLALTSGVIFSTMSVQDLKDQAGDRARGRRTAPLVLGEERARGGIAVAVVAWSVVCCAFWGVSAYVVACCGGVGLVVAARVVLRRGFAEDRTTWRLWSCWLVLVYALPLVRGV